MKTVKTVTFLATTRNDAEEKEKHWKSANPGVSVHSRVMISNPPSVSIQINYVDVNKDNTSSFTLSALSNDG